MKTLKMALAFLPLLFVLNISAQTTDEIVQKHIDAVGGRDNWSKVKSLKIESTVKAQGAEVHITILQIDKKAMRQDISVMGMSGYTIIKNTEGWNYMPWQGQTKPEAMTADDLKNSQNDLYLQDDFITYKELEKKLEFFGKDDVDGTECLKLKMTDKNGKETTYFIDPANYYVIKQIQKITSNGKEMETTTFFSDYKKVDAGIVFPMSIRSDWGESETTSLIVNPPIDETVFAPAK